MKTNIQTDAAAKVQTIIIQNRYSRNQPNAQSTDMDEQNVLCPSMHYHYVIKRNTMLIHVTTWMTLKIMLRHKKSHTMITFAANV